MDYFQQKITLIKIRGSGGRNLNENLQWLGASLGLFNLRDKDKSCFRLFIELLRAAKKREPISSDDLADRLKLSRGTVIHHINKLMNAGIVVPEGNQYVLRVDTLAGTIKEIEKDTKRLLEDIQDVAKDLDKWLQA